MARGFGVMMAAGVPDRLSRLGLGLVLFAAMLINSLNAGLSGVLIPLGLEKFRIDPAVTSTVFVTTMTDVMGFFSFLGLATLFGLAARSGLLGGLCRRRLPAPGGFRRAGAPQADRRRSP